MVKLRAIDRRCAALPCAAPGSPKRSLTLALPPSGGAPKRDQESRIPAARVPRVFCAHTARLMSATARIPSNSSGNRADELRRMLVAQRLSRRGYQGGLLDIDLWELALQIRDLRQVIEDDVWVARIPDQKILVVGLGRIEALQRIDTRDDPVAEHVGLIQLGNIRQRSLLLGLVSEEDLRAILRAGVRTLPIQLGGIVRH